MIKQIDILISPENINDTDYIRKKIRLNAHLPFDKPFHFNIVRRSIDARKAPKFLLKIDVYIDELPKSNPSINSLYKNVSDKKRVVIVGAGPGGYFAALECLENGLRPIILERGKDVQERRKDLRQIQQFGIVNEHSNYCFGEGGAGTYSDGKLYTRSSKRGDIKKVLQILVDHGSNPEILIDSHPHIGSNKLPEVIKAIRETILEFGGEVHFGSFVTDLIIVKNEVKGVIVNEKDEFLGDSVILATGHSARDIYYLLKKKHVKIEVKGFAMGVRIEHPQPLIDQIQYKENPRHENLPASSYGLVCQSFNRGVFSFCMCPGGIIVPSATSPGEIVVNGMSLSRRDSPFANSGIVVAIEESDLSAFSEHGELAGLEYQKQFEQMAFNAGPDGSQKAPAQRMLDFVNGKQSRDLPETSYIPGIHSAPLHELMPKHITKRLKDGFNQFRRKMSPYYTNEAKIVGVESRTSSPVRIPRNNESLMHVEIKNLYPCGEGAGYAGGIVSAAMDGQRIVQSIIKK
jgi:uncharacterized FAD-dependent dehydrogenase